MTDPDRMPESRLALDPYELDILMYALKRQHAVDKINFEEQMEVAQEADPVHWRNDPLIREADEMLDRSIALYTKLEQLRRDLLLQRLGVGR